MNTAVGGERLLTVGTVCYTQRDRSPDKKAPALKPLGRSFSLVPANTPGRLHDNPKPGSENGICRKPVSEKSSSRSLVNKDNKKGRGPRRRTGPRLTVESKTCY